MDTTLKAIGPQGADIRTSEHGRQGLPATLGKGVSADPLCGPVLGEGPLSSKAFGSRRAAAAIALFHPTFDVRRPMTYTFVASCTAGGRGHAQEADVAAG